MTDAIATAFANRALIPACEAARVLGIDAKTLRNLVRGGAIRTVIVGRVERFTEADLRAFLRGDTCLSISQSVPRTGTTTSSSKAKGFSARLGAKANAKLKLVSAD
jgi:excisionase family DNA binding protein